MCLIIKRDPGFEIPFDKFKSAIHVNPDGYGLSFPDENGKLVTIRNPERPDAEALYRTINEDLIDRDLLIHLRYTTVGKTNLRNAHPFPILEKATDGIDIRMAHNGTLYDYKKLAGEDESDTRAFVKHYVRPLFKRMAKAMPPEQLLSDPFLKQLLEGQLTSSSVLTLIDGNGQSLVCNAEGNGGKQEDGWYYSNSYSFDRTHREPVVYTPKFYNTGYGNYSSPKQSWPASKPAKDKVKVFLWDDLMDFSLLKKRLWNPMFKGVGVTVGKYVPFFELGGLIQQPTLCLEETEDMWWFNDMPIGFYKPLPLYGRMYEVDEEDLKILDQLYWNGQDYHRTEVEVYGPTSYSRNVMKVQAYFNSIEHFGKQSKEGDARMFKGLDLEIFGTEKKGGNEVYSYEV